MKKFIKLLKVLKGTKVPQKVCKIIIAKIILCQKLQLIDKSSCWILLGS